MIATAIYESGVAQARARTETHDLQLERMRRVFKTAWQESDRSAAILIFALAEDLMIEGLRVNLNQKVKGGWKSVTDANGVLATASDRITMLELLNWARPETCADLRLLKSIRNRFAHHVEIAGFSDIKIKAWCSALSHREEPVVAYHNAEERANWRPFTQREVFLMRACCAVAQLQCDIAVAPAAQRMMVAPADVEGRGFDSLPENLKEARRLMADVFMAFMPPRSLVDPVSQPS